MSFIAEWRDSSARALLQYNKDHRLTDKEGNYTRAGKMNILSNVMLVALGIIGILAATGGMSAAAASWSAVGLGGGMMIAQLLGGDLKKRKVDLILAAICAAGLIAVGVLGGTGVLTGAQLGYSLIGIVGVNAIFWCCCCRALAARQAHAQHVRFQQIAND